jgi:hypothetical protein
METWGESGLLGLASVEASEGRVASVRLARATDERGSRPVTVPRTNEGSTEARVVACLTSILSAGLSLYV